MHVLFRRFERPAVRAGRDRPGRARAHRMGGESPLRVDSRGDAAATARQPRQVPRPGRGVYRPARHQGSPGGLDLVQRPRWRGRAARAPVDVPARPGRPRDSHRELAQRRVRLLLARSILRAMTANHSARLLRSRDVAERTGLCARGSEARPSRSPPRREAPPVRPVAVPRGQARSDPRSTRR